MVPQDIYPRWSGKYERVVVHLRVQDVHFHVSCAAKQIDGFMDLGKTYEEYLALDYMEQQHTVGKLIVGKNGQSSAANKSWKMGKLLFETFLVLLGDPTPIVSLAIELLDNSD